MMENAASWMFLSQTVTTEPLRTRSKYTLTKPERLTYNSKRERERSTFLFENTGMMLQLPHPSCAVSNSARPTSNSTATTPTKNSIVASTFPTGLLCMLIRVVLVTSKSSARHL